METSIKFDNKQIEIIQGDIIESDCEAIVNAANNHLWMGSGVAGAIKRKGGQAIEEAAMKQGPIEAGEAALTHGGDLKAKYVVHAAAMGQDLVTSGELIKQATENSLKLAEANRISSIAFTALGTGVGGFPMDKCARLMIPAVYEFLQSSKKLITVNFVLFDIAGFNEFCNVLRNIETQENK